MGEWRCAGNGFELLRPTQKQSHRAESFSLLRPCSELAIGNTSSQAGWHPQTLMNIHGGQKGRDTSLALQKQSHTPY